MVSTEQKALLSIISSVVHGREVNVGNDVDWSGVFNISIEQGVGGVLYNYIQKRYKQPQFSNLSVDTKLEWYALSSQIELQNKKVHVVLRKVVAELGKNSIPCILLKGQGLAQLYPNPYSRQSGDIDIYVGESKYEAAKKVFTDKGWLVGDGIHEDFKHLRFSVDGVMIELHKYAAILPGYSGNRYFQELTSKSLQSLIAGFFLNEKNEFDTCGLFVSTFPTALNFAYTFYHAFFHFIGEGLVLRQVTDVALMLKKLNKEKVQHSDVKKHLEKMGFLMPWQVFGCLIVKYLGFPIEEIPCYDARYENKADKVMEIILEEAHTKRNRTTNMCIEYLRICGCHLRLFSLFPADCIGFLTRMIANTTLKYKNMI